MKAVPIYPLKEFKIWLVVFLLTNVLNVVSILIYKTEWKELYTQLVFVFMLSIAFYILTGVVRVIVLLVRKKH